MAAHTKIIELFGIPACGKTTLASYLSLNCSKGIRIATVKDILTESRKHPIRLALSFSVKTVLAGIKVRLAVPFDKKHKEITIWDWLLKDVHNRYAKKYTDYDLLIIDHGDIQSFVSLERGDNLHEDSKFVAICSKYIDVSSTSVYVYCKIDENNALSRIHKRNRKRGRIDVISHEEEQLKELYEEKIRFDFFAQLLRSKEKTYLELDMNGTCDNISELLLNLLKSIK